MEWLAPAQAAMTIGGMVLVVVFGYLHLRERQPHLGIYLGAWVAYTLRALCEFATTVVAPENFILLDSLSAGAMVLNILSGLLLLWGSFRFLGRRLSLVYPVAAAAAAVWTVFMIAADAGVLAISAPGFLYLGAASIVTGWAWLRHGGTDWSRLAGWTFIAWGIHRLDYPLLRGVEWFAPVGFALGAVFAFLTAVIVIVAHFDRMRIQLAESEQRYRQIFELNKSVMLIIDPETAGIVDANEAALRYYGWPRAEFIGMRITDINTLSPDEVHAEMANAAEDRRAHFVFRHRRAHGVISDVEVYAGPVTIDERPMLYSIVHDISDRVRAERMLAEYKDGLERLVESRTAELSATNERLEAATRAKDVFMASMSHELRTPLNSIIGFSGILAQGMTGQLNEEQVRQVAMIQTSGRHLLGLVNDLLDLSRIDSGRLSPAPIESDLTEALQMSAAAIRPLADRKGLDLLLDLPDEPLVRRTDRRFFDQIMWNLLGNAIKYTESGSVALKMEASDGRTVRIEVTDTGPGVAPVDRDRVFEDFDRLGRPGSDDGGVGLGLAISRRLARALGGDIWIEGEAGQGATFVFLVSDADTVAALAHGKTTEPKPVDTRDS
ncbi:MAG: ATP-binding protein [Coriobacteriia bacterium]|nr:ATP-binding protein [Coriobacteriia bacterium]